MKTKITIWKCTKPGCSWSGNQPYGSGSISCPDENGDIHGTSETHCPLCGSSITFETQTVDVYLYNSTQECPKASI
jgi:hypothetical protein